MTMRNGAYVVFDSLDRHGGVERKIHGQMDALGKAGLLCEIRSFPGPKGRIGAVMRRLPLVDGHGPWYRSLIAAPPAYLYIRKPVLSGAFVRKLSRFKRAHPDVPVLLELPTYPYDLELRTLRGLPYLLKDRWGRRRLASAVDRVVTLTDDEQIFGVRTLNFQNGVDAASVPPVAARQVQRDPVVLTAVAKVTKAHGYDLVLRGLHEYRRAGGLRQIRFNVVGDGGELQGLRQLAAELCLEDCVVFHGYKEGAALTRIYSDTDVGLGGFGYHRKGLYRASSLKTREYLARGIPVASGPEEPLSSLAPFFYMEVDAQERPVDIRDLIAFRDRMCSQTGLSAVIRGFAEREVSMEAAMRNVTDYLRCRVVWANDVG